MGQGQRKYEKAHKVQAVKLAEEIGAGRAAKELGSPVDTLYGWQKAVREARKSDDLLKRDFQADKPLEKCVTDGVYRAAAQQYGIRQSMNSDGGRWLTIPFVFFCVN